jgi:replicative DNA helicase
MADNNQQTRRRNTQNPIDTTVGHLPPQALEMERMVLGALMIDHDAFSVISEILHPDTFYEKKNQLVYQAIQTLNLNEHPVDHNTVLEELKREGSYEEAGGLPYLLELTEHVMSSAHIEYHARILAQKYMARQLISYASMIETNAFDESVDVDVLMQKAEGTLFELSQ